MYKFNLLGKKQYKLNNRLTVKIPLVGDIWGNDRDLSVEQDYLHIASLFIQTPTDLMLELNSMGIYWTDITEYELFIMLFSAFLINDKDNTELAKQHKSQWDIVFSGVNYDELKIFNKGSDIKSIAIVDGENNVIFDLQIYNELSDLFCCILHSEKNREYTKVPEKDTRDYILRRAKIKRDRQLSIKQKSSSVLDGVILFLVNNCNFKYDFETVKSLSLYDLYACFKQINKNKEVDYLMSGYYFGTVDLKKISDNKLQRIIV